jgi:hypothetical protein
MTRVDVERVRELMAGLAEINALPFDEIEWFEHGEQLAVSAEDARDFRFCGLSNKNFVEFEWWLGPSEINGVPVDRSKTQE